MVTALRILTGENDNPSDLRMRIGLKERSADCRTRDCLLVEESTDLRMRTGEKALRMRTVDRELHFLTGAVNRFSSSGSSIISSFSSF